MSIALDLHNKHQFGSHYCDPQGEFGTIIGMLSYGAPHESITDVIQKTQHNAQLWNNILKATGGTLILLECFSGHKLKLC